jgi:hypothetical protein
MIEAAGGFVGLGHATLVLPENTDHVRPLDGMDLNPEERASWLAMLADYEIVQPFAQFSVHARDGREDWRAGVFASMRDLLFAGNVTQALSIARGAGLAGQLDEEKLSGWRKKLLATQSDREGAGPPSDPRRLDVKLKQLGYECSPGTAHKTVGQGGQTTVAILDYLSLGSLGLLWRVCYQDGQGNPLRDGVRIYEARGVAIRDLEALGF